MKCYIWNSKHSLYYISEHFLEEFAKQGMVVFIADGNHGLGEANETCSILEAKMYTHEL